MKPIVVIVGRPNVGKSTLFNRITKTRNAIVDNLSGVTRDRNFGDAVWNDIYFTLVDTGGFVKGNDDFLACNIRCQVKHAIAEADVIVAVLDGKNGISPFDTEIVQLIRKNTKKKILYIVNKIDGIKQEYKVDDFYSLGIEKFYSISAEHGYGLSSFLDKLISIFPLDASSESNIKSNLIRIAIIGRPNVGKSSLVNSIVGKDRMVVSNTPGTTRDTSNSEVFINNKSYLIIDTAGIRRKGKVSQKIEKFSVVKTLKCLNNCHVALILVDAVIGITDQDIHVAGYANDRGCGTIFVINKCDLIKNNKAKVIKQYSDELKVSAKFLNFSPIIGVSALTGFRVKQIFKLIDKIYLQYSARINTGHLNRIFNKSIEMNAPSLYKGKRIKFYYTTQIGTNPPTIVSFVNYPEAVHFSYKRYLINKLREFTDLKNIPLKLIFRQRSGKNLVFRSKNK